MSQALRITGVGSLMAWGLALCWLGTGCSFGPRALERSHGRYYESVRQVYEEQFLRNIVHMRYMESPSALEVAAIAAQYELSAQAEARPFFLAPNPTNNIFKTFAAVLPDASATAADRPTITLDPAYNGEQVRRFLTPIPQETFLFLAESGWPASALVRLWVERLNGVPNAVDGPGRPPCPDFARFRRVAELLQSAQDRGLLVVRAEDHFKEVGGPLPASAVTAAALVNAAKNGLEYRPLADQKSWMLLRRERRLWVEIRPGAAGSPELMEFYGLLHLVPGQPRYGLSVVAGVPDPLHYPSPLGTDMRTELRSTSQVFFYLAHGVEVPPEHVQAGLVRLPIDAEGRVCDESEITRGLFVVHACKGHRPPETAYVAVKYRDHWYYIDDRDQASKTMLLLMLQLNRLDFVSTKGGPLLTLPAGR